MDLAEQAESIVARAIPSAALSGFGEDAGFSSSIAAARVGGSAQLGGGDPLELSCYLVDSVSSAAVEDLARIAAAEGGGAIPTVVARATLSDRRQQAIRERGLAFFDAAGNAWLQAPGAIVDRRGMTMADEAGGRRRQAGAGVFSDKATAVIRSLLIRSPLVGRELCALSAERGVPVSPCFVSKVADSLEARRYARRTTAGLRLSDRKALLGDWAEAYRLMRHPRPQGWYVHAAGAGELLDTVGAIVQGTGALAGLAAAALHDGHAMFDTVDVYARDAEKLDRALEAAGAVRADRGANVNVVKPRYEKSAFFDLQRIGGAPVTSALQTYLDLQLQPRRGREAAEHLYETMLREAIEPEPPKVDPDHLTKPAR